MDATAWGFLGALLGAIIGAAASIATTVISTRNAARLQAQADALDRQERSRAFQRENLLSVQDALQTLGRACGQAQYLDVLAHRQGAEWGRGPLGDDINDALGLAHRHLSALVERVADDALRADLKETHWLFTLQTMAASEVEAESRMRAATEAYEHVMSNLGAVLRSNY